MGVWQDGCVRFRTWNVSTPCRTATLQNWWTLQILFCTPLTDPDRRYWPAFPLAPSCLEYPSYHFSLWVYLRLFVFAFFWTCGRPPQLPIPQMWVQLTVKWVLVSSRLLCSDESNLRLPSDSVGPVSSPTVDSTGHLPGRQLWLASKSQKIPFFPPSIFYLSPCPLPIYFPRPNIPSCAWSSAFTHQPRNHKATWPPWIFWHSTSHPALSGEGGCLVVLFGPFKRPLKL